MERVQVGLCSDSLRRNKSVVKEVSLVASLLINE